MDKASAQRVTARFFSKEACIVAIGEWDGKRCLLKNRDRNYRPKIRVVHEIRKGVEVAYVYDDLTGWVEGLNEYGIGIVNAALQVARDEAEKKIVKTVGKKSKDGARILKALECKDLDSCIESLCSYKGGIKGHTFVSDGEQSRSIEATSKHDCQVRTVANGKTHVRTNHGFYYEDAGYQDGPNYLSSVTRRNKAQRVLREVEKPEDLAPALMEHRLENRKDPNNMVRNTRNMKTTSQMVLDLDSLILYLYLLPGKVTFQEYENRLPKEYKPKITVKVFKYKDGKEELKVEEVEDSKGTHKEAHEEPVVQIEPNHTDEVKFYLKDKSLGSVLAGLIITAIDPPGYWFVGRAKAYERGQGYGTELYMAAIKYATEDGGGLISDEEASVSAKVVRNRVRQRGVHVQQGYVFKTPRSFMTFSEEYPDEEASDIREAVLMTSRRGAAYPLE